MRYIRTENGIYEPLTDINSKSYNFKAKFYDSYVLVSKSTIVKSADTIEELCDEFVLLSFDDKPTIIEEHWGWSSRFNHAKILKEEIETREKDVGGWATVYGAIWTNKGLIYVAKMNDKGELELL